MQHVITRITFDDIIIKLKISTFIVSKKPIKAGALMGFLKLFTNIRT